MRVAPTRLLQEVTVLVLGVSVIVLAAFAALLVNAWSSPPALVYCTRVGGPFECAADLAVISVLGAASFVLMLLWVRRLT